MSSSRPTAPMSSRITGRISPTSSRAAVTTNRANASRYSFGVSLTHRRPDAASSRSAPVPCHAVAQPADHLQPVAATLARDPPPDRAGAGSTAPCPAPHSGTATGIRRASPRSPSSACRPWNGTTDDARVGAEAAAPEPVAQHHDRRLAGPILLRGEPAPHRRRDPEQRERVGGQIAGAEALRRRPGRSGSALPLL